VRKREIYEIEKYERYQRHKKMRERDVREGEIEKIVREGEKDEKDKREIDRRYEVGVSRISYPTENRTNRVNNRVGRFGLRVIKLKKSGCYG